MRACKACSLPLELAVQSDSLLDQGRSLREISRLLSMAGREVSFMAVARHKKHYERGLSTEKRLYMQKVRQVAQQVEKLSRKVARM